MTRSAVALHSAGHRLLAESLEVSALVVAYLYTYTKYRRKRSLPVGVLRTADREHRDSVCWLLPKGLLVARRWSTRAPRVGTAMSVDSTSMLSGDPAQALATGDACRLPVYAALMAMA